MILASRAPLDPPRRRKSASRNATTNLVLLPAILLLSAALATSGVRAQGVDINEAVTVEDLGLMLRLHGGARAAGMAGAYASMGDDVHALVYNPAGLARVKRIEAGIGVQHQRDELNNVFFGSPATVNLTSTEFDYIAAAYPLPTYRGSFVIAFGAYQLMSGDIDILNRGFNTVTSTDDDYRLQQSGDIVSYNVGFGVDLSPNLSIGGNLVVMDGTINALTQLQYGPRPPFSNGQLTGVSIVDDAEVDLDGLAAVLGFQYHPHPKIHIGLSVSTPTRIDLDGGAVTEEIDFYFNSPDTLTEDRFAIETDIQLPFRVDGGISVALPNAVVALDLGYADWTQLTINDFQLKDQSLRAILRETLEIRAGAEFVIPGSPLRVRAGYAYLPYPLQYLQADRIEGMQIQEATIDTERQLVSGGFGFLAGRVLTIDAAYEYLFGKRSIETLVDERTTTRVLVSASYRF